jgi:hypothetical protein
MANANKPSQGSSTQQGMNAPSRDQGRDMDSQQNRSTQHGQGSQKDMNKQANQTGKQGSGKNK